jgi:hypothetical protein
MAVPSPYGSSSVGLSITSMATAGAKTAGPTEKFAIDVLVICFEIWFVKTFARTLLATGRPIAEQRNACNGRRQRQDRQNIQWTYHWRHLHPVSADFTLVFALGSDDPSRCARASLRSSAVLRAQVAADHQRVSSCCALSINLEASPPSRSSATSATSWSRRARILSILCREFCRRLVGAPVGANTGTLRVSRSDLRSAVRTRPLWRDHQRYRQGP